ncbi:hypothetical protein SAMN04487833_13211 [Sarcina sp. DSM 11001]|uniref:hypothetical protein n=1 Tax=Sarcina sp. DSM 11001 TaxID=1798184 RepID=UPI000889DC79|nr:hypothetical protein [Sarcina sp. DSM 11001]SDL79787.1 hypothetical protein SAMN04487833_13211 [Sarcina sp. DSM 11001]
MKNRRFGFLFRLVAAAIAAMLFVGTFSVTNAEAASRIPANCRFVRWGSSDFSSFDIRWNPVKDCDGYQTCLSLTNGTKAQYSSFNYDVVGARFKLPARDHVYMIKVRSFLWLAGGKVYSSWSNLAFITPSPVSIKVGIVSATAKHPEARLKWNTIYGSDGYNIFVTTNPHGTWRWNQSTAAKATANSAVISKYSGGRLKLYTRYYFKIVTRRRRNGVFCTVPMPSNSYYSGWFNFYK